MIEFDKYAKIYFLNTDADMDELENHLSMNGYNFGIDKKRRFLFVFIDELDYVATILEDRNINYGVSVY